MACPVEEGISRRLPVHSQAKRLARLKAIEFLHNQSYALYRVVYACAKTLIEVVVKFRRFVNFRKLEWFGFEVNQLVSEAHQSA